MSTIKIHDRADELRFEIFGRFSGESVDQVASLWTDALPISLHRKLTIDISSMTSYDGAGRKLFREMHRHGTQFSAGNPQALGFLGEITSLNKGGTMLVLPDPKAAPIRESSEPRRSWNSIAKRAGGS